MHQISCLEMRTYFSFGLILWNIPNSITPQIPSACYRSRSNLYPPLTPSPLSPLPVPDRGTGNIIIKKKINDHLANIVHVVRHINVIEGRKEGNVLFNDALNTYLRLYGVGHMIKYHTDSERKLAAATIATLFDL